MKIAIFLNALGPGGTEKAASRWARGLQERKHEVTVLAMDAGPREVELRAAGLPVMITGPEPARIRECLDRIKPNVIHAHVPGQPHAGDLLGEAVSRLRRIPVVSTNIFGRLENSAEDKWTDFRLFISWTSAVQAARRAFLHLDRDFFLKRSVASYPLDPDDGPTHQEVADFRNQHEIRNDEILFGRISRPEPNKWTNLVLESFRLAAAKLPKVKLLLREAPPKVARAIEKSRDHERFVLLPATSDARELRLTMASLNVVLHTSVIGESFGYGIAEPMNYGKPAIANSTPWQDQAQIELVRHGECGYIASTAPAMAERICELATNVGLRLRMGERAQSHIRCLADPPESLDRLENAFEAAIKNNNNPRADQDLTRAKEAAMYLDANEFGDSFAEQIALRPLYYRVRLHQWRHAFLSSKRTAKALAP